MCNSELIKEIVKLGEKYNCYIFNKRFFENNYTKLDMQNILANNSVKTPEIMDMNCIEKIETPIFCKENKHAGIVLKTYTSNTLVKFLEKFNKKDFYLEKCINAKEELKIYYINKVIFSNGSITDNIKDICKKISEKLFLDVFSADLIMDSKKDYYVIDINPAAGFYMLDIARKELINNIKNNING